MKKAKFYFSHYSNGKKAYDCRGGPVCPPILIDPFSFSCISFKSLNRVLILGRIAIRLGIIIAKGWHDDRKHIVIPINNREGMV
jgi:hypothetical protein